MVEHSHISHIFRKHLKNQKEIIFGIKRKYFCDIIFMSIKQTVNRKVLNHNCHKNSVTNLKTFLYILQNIIFFFIWFCFEMVPECHSFIYKPTRLSFFPSHIKSHCCNVTIQIKNCVFHYITSSTRSKSSIHTCVTQVLVEYWFGAEPICPHFLWCCDVLGERGSPSLWNKSTPPLTEPQKRAKVAAQVS